MIYIIRLESLKKWIKLEWKMNIQKKKMVRVTSSRYAMGGPSKSEKNIRYPYLFEQRYSLTAQQIITTWVPDHLGFLGLKSLIWLLFDLFFTPQKSIIL